MHFIQLKILWDDDKGDEYAYSCFLRYPDGHVDWFLLALAGPTTDYGCHRGGYQFSLWSYKEGITLYLSKNV